MLENVFLIDSDETKKISSAFSAGIKGRSIVIMILLLGAALHPVFAGALRTQVFELQNGWNAIYLNVDPLVRDPAQVFTNSPVDIVSSYDGATYTKQFVADANVNMINKLGWATWYAPSREDSFLSNFQAMQGNAAYLVHATDVCTISISGEVLCFPVAWKADGYNLVGFTLDSLAPPTFAQFFGASDAHRKSAVYRLTGGVWKKLTDTSNSAMRSGEAFWIYTDGASSYQGPLEVSAGESGMVVLGLNSVHEVTIRNRTGYPVTAHFKHVIMDGEKLPLSIVVSMIGDLCTGVHQVPSDLGDGSWEIELPPLEGGTGFKVPLAVLSDRLEAVAVSSLLCVTSDLGTETWIPVKASREDLQ